MKITIQHADIHLIDLQTRLPFKYGIATMTSAPHAFVRVAAEVEGRSWTGIAADHLPPKWFTKVPEKPLDDEIDEMLQVIEHAVAIAPGMRGESVFDVWQQLHDEQANWARRRKLAPLLSNFGTSFVERALIEAFCQSAGQTLAEALQCNSLGIRLERFDSRLEGVEPADLLTEEPRRRAVARHTVGMADPIRSSDIAPADRVRDGLPQSLDECIDRYGLKHFKIKVSGNAIADVGRLQQIAAAICEHASQDFAFSMDGNEQFRSLDAFRAFWDDVTRAADLQSFFHNLLFVEQPFHRDVALAPDVLGEMRRWDDRPPLIIDESDAEPDSLPRALRLGYHGTSHKNCKGVFRGVAHACLLEKLRRDEIGMSYVMSGEDLANIGPVALLQDLAVAASLGIESIERNGHHYFAGLSAFPRAVQQQVLDFHGDLYERTEGGWPTLRIRRGELDLTSISAAPLGVRFALDVEQFTPVAEWRQSRARTEQ